MKFLKLKFEHARIIKEKSLKNMLGSNRFFHPINRLHVYNSICVLFDRTPKPQLRETDDKYMPVYDDIMSLVSDGYIKTNLVGESENITTIKTFSNSNKTSSYQYSWVDCKYVTGTLYPIFLYNLSEILNKKESLIEKKSFDETIFEIQSMGVRNGDNSITYTNDKINNLLDWCKVNSSTPISNYLVNKQEDSRPTGFGKKVYRGIVNSNTYSGVIYIPLSDELYVELITNTKGFSNILDGGLVTIIGYCEVDEDDIEGFTKIGELNSVRKFSEFGRGVDWNKTIYKDIDINKLEPSIKQILKKCDITISDYQESYDEMLKKVNKIKFSGDMNKFIKDVGYKLNYFIENSIDKIYK